jgi:hypothetical protein
MIPNEEAKDENQNIFASQIWFYAPAKIHSSAEPLGRIFLGHKKTQLKSWVSFFILRRKRDSNPR